MLLGKLTNKDIVLASRSPRRRELLSALGISFRLIIPDIEENYPGDLEREGIAIYLSEKKASSVLKLEGGRSENLLVIASDTIVCRDKTIYNKPSDRSDAIEMLKDLSGSRHSVITAVSMADNKKMKSFYSETQVYFAKLQDEEIEFYVDNYKPYDKAGSYGIQEWIGYIGVEMIEGSYYNVMGLPVQRLYKELKNFIE